MNEGHIQAERLSDGVEEELTADQLRAMTAAQWDDFTIPNNATAQYQIMIFREVKIRFPVEHRELRGFEFPAVFTK